MKTTLIISKKFESVFEKMATDNGYKFEILGIQQSFIEYEIETESVRDLYFLGIDVGLEAMEKYNNKKTRKN